MAITTILKTAYPFQFTPLHERRLDPSIGDAGAILFQFTPLHERRQGRNCNGNRPVISIHASTREATESLSPDATSVYEFQFTPLHERRQIFNPVMDYTIYISIHASTREATQTHHQHYMCCFYFNSRLYTRGNSATRKAYFGVKDFNSRLYMRGSVILKISTLVILYFNSRLYMRGSINVIETGGIGALISIHAST